VWVKDLDSLFLAQGGVAKIRYDEVGCGTGFGGKGLCGRIEHTVLGSCTHRWYGSSANACWIVSIAPWTSEGVMGVTLITILTVVLCCALVLEFDLTCICALSLTLVFKKID